MTFLGAWEIERQRIAIIFSSPRYSHRIKIFYNVDTMNKERRGFSG